MQKELHLESYPPFAHKCLAEPCLLSFQPLSAFGLRLVEVDHPRYPKRKSEIFSVNARLTSLLQRKVEV